MIILLAKVMKFYPILCLLILFTGCSKQEEAKCEVNWYDATETPKRHLAQYNFQLQKGQDVMLGASGQIVQFGENHKVKVRLFWNEQGIFTEVFSAGADDWESEVLQLDNGTTKTHRFTEGIIAEAVARK